MSLKMRNSLKNDDLNDNHPIISAFIKKLSISLTFPEVSPHTKQEFKDECDINTILARYNRTGELPLVNQALPQYLDVTGHDFQEHMNIVRGAQDMFNGLPSELRNRFNNDPAQFLDFTANVENREEMAKLGLLSESATKSIVDRRVAMKNALAAAEALKSGLPQSDQAE